ncbi:MAG TPA: molybdopterin-dependent oxidoreductase [Streptosporangiaceae bacterium]|nr:molybdopterin-dependent oxidoreductase [Streptosporangiaceae bacterium]
MTYSQQQPQPGRRPAAQGPGLGRAALAGSGAVVGIVTALVALGAAQLIAAVLSSPIGAPVAAVGELSINHAPSAIKNFAIREFGSSDKIVLVWGIRGVLIIFAAVIGILAVRKLWQGMVGLAVFGAIGVYAALSQPTSTATDVLPSLIGAVVASFALRYFAGLGTRLAAARGSASQGPVRPGSRPPSATPPGPRQPESAQPDSAEPDSAEPDSARPEPSQPDSAQPGATWPPAAQPGATRPGGPNTPHPGASWRPVEPAWRPIEPAWSRASDLVSDRRRFLFGSAAAAAVSLIAYAGGSWLGETRDVSAIQHALKLPAPAKPAQPLPPGANLKIPGLSSFITPNNSFYRVDTAIVVPEIAPASWQLRIHGMVQKELVLSFKDLIKRPLIEDYVTLCCVSNPVGGPYIGNAKWLGASLRGLLQEAGIKAGASQLLATSSDGFTSGSPVQIAMDSGRDSLLAVAMNDAPLPVDHGFPVRQVIPGLYGYVSACKWIVDIEVTTYEAAQAYWVPRGWSSQAPIKTESRIDVPTGANPIKAGQRVSIAGVAWAQHKGIEAVEVRVAGGPWHEATLADVPGIDTWRQWVYEWDASVRPGTYLIEARATDKTGYTQTALQEPPEPNGATGYPTVQVSVVS